MPTKTNDALLLRFSLRQANSILLIYCYVRQLVPFTLGTIYLQHMEGGDVMPRSHHGS